ncbi:MAG: micrococcal nuclease [Patescibacteria group bacterium]|nr:micrococcal nuclease [Patescibacteria group bacterium]
MNFRKSKKQIKFIISGITFAFALLIFVIDSIVGVQSEKVDTQPSVGTQMGQVSQVFGDSSNIVRVVKVIDGDTIAVQTDLDDASSKITLRLIGINTPETVDPRKKVECFGKEASAKAKEILSGKMVRLEYDDTQDTIDKYGRKLAYVFIQNTDSEIFFNTYMIEQGYAYEYTYSKPYKYQKAFKDAQKRAEAEGRGLWSPTACNGKKNV